MRRSVLQKTTTPKTEGVLHWIWPKNVGDWLNLNDENSYWAATLGNSIIADVSVRPANSSESWEGFKVELLRHAVDGEMVNELKSYPIWDVEAIEKNGKNAAELAGELWY
jgi:hypothetical protein